jgi:hypothetical protein
MHLKSRAILGVATVGAAIGAALVPTTSAFAAPAMSATWANQSVGLNLQNGDNVSVSGTGFKPGVTAYLVECSGTTGQSNCDLGTLQTTQTDANGALTLAAFPVHTGTVGDGVCNANSTCFIAASTDPTGADLTQASAAQIQFDRLQVSPRTGLKNGTVLNLVGAGYNPGATVYVSECNSTDKPTALQHCDANSIATFTADAKGAFTGTYNKTHTNLSASQSGPYSCTAGTTCIVAGSDNLANPGAGNIGGALVKFAALAKTVTTAKAPSSVVKGAKFAIKAKVSAAGNGVAGLKVTLFKVTSSGLSKVASSTTSSTGAHKFAGLTQKKTSKYEVKSAANATYAASHSKVVKVTT